MLIFDLILEVLFLQRLKELEDEEEQIARIGIAEEMET
jgi:hypothetical protein